MHPATDVGSGDSTTGRLVVRRLGRRSYSDGCALQEAAARSVERGGADALLYVEHPPVITLGRGTDAGQLLAAPARLAEAGISVVRTDRGGGATFHGPGQIVGYPIIDLRRRGIGVRTYLRALEAVLVAALQDAGVDAHVRPGLTGVWTASGKVAAIGVAVRRGVTRHGFALNLTTDLEPFASIVPCGLQEPVTSLERVGCTVDASRLQASLASLLQSTLASFVEQPPIADVVARAARTGLPGAPT